MASSQLEKRSSGSLEGGLISTDGRMGLPSRTTKFQGKVSGNSLLYITELLLFELSSTTNSSG